MQPLSDIDDPAILRSIIESNVFAFRMNEEILHHQINVLKFIVRIYRYALGGVLLGALGYAYYVGTQVC